jgi:prephenate dehydrogenase
MKRSPLWGLGLMGGSLGLALRKRGGWRVAALARREETLRVARRCGAIHEGSTDPADVLPGRTWWFSVRRWIKLFRWQKPIGGFLSRDALLMDVGSVKGPMVRELEKLF